MKKFYATFLCVFCLLVATNTFGQIRISEQIQPSKVVTQEANKLYFVDFWATWCGPCVHAKKYLGTLQKQYAKDFYIVSLSEENPQTVRKYLDKRPTDLAVAIDYDKETFKNHGIQSLPHSVLYNANGKKLWEGHPADFNGSHISKFLRQTSARANVDEFIKLNEYKKAVVKNEVYEPGEDFELMASNENYDLLNVKEFKDYTSYEGSLKSILAYLLKAYDEQVQLSSSVANTSYKLNIKHGSRKHRNLVKHVLKTLKLKLENSTNNGDVMVMTTDMTKFWDTNQINWGSNNAKYLIGDNQIQADNVTFEDIKYRLSNLLEMPVVLAASEDIHSNTLHDWQIHYKFFELMQSDLSDNYGIDAKKKMAEYPVYRIENR